MVGKIARPIATPALRASNLQPRKRTLAAMATNTNRNRHFSGISKSKAQLFAYYDAQPPATRALFQNFPENLWPASYEDHGHGFPEAQKRYLANLRNVWGPDHPAVLAAKQQVAVRGRKVVQLATPDDLDF